MTRTRTTRYVTLLSVVLALALTAALAACGSDEPSGVTGPGGTASTPTETSVSPAQTPTTTGSGDATTATDATAPPATGPTSDETDREALVAVYNATNGETWYESDNWLSDAPLGEWEGVTTDDDGRVTRLSLGRNDLSGEIPAELGSLSNLEALSLNENYLKRGDTGRVGRPLQPGKAVARKQPVERGDTGRAGQPLQPDIVCR